MSIVRHLENITVIKIKLSSKYLNTLDNRPLQLWTIGIIILIGYSIILIDDLSNRRYASVRQSPK